MPSHLFGATLGLLSALIWGSGDFCGGLAARRSTPYQALALTSVTGLGCMLLLAIATGESWPGTSNLAWGAVAGVSGALGIITLYAGLATGAAALVSPIAGVVGALLPVLVGSFLEGLPSGQQWAGFAAGLGGIWLATTGAPKGPDGARPRGLGLAVLAGLGFGCFFILIAQVDRGVFAPLAASKFSASLVAALILIYLKSPFPSPRSLPIGALAGILDAGGNIFYFLATLYTRLDIAAVLSSLYPAGTVLLSSLVLKERVNFWQKVGVGLCLVAIALIVG